MAAKNTTQIHFKNDEGFKAYNADKKAFMMGHEIREKSTLTGGHIYKVYTREDGETFHECNDQIFKEISIPNGHTGPKTVTAYVADRIEWFTSLNGTSKFWVQEY